MKMVIWSTLETCFQRKIRHHKKKKKRSLPAMIKMMNMKIYQKQLMKKSKNFEKYWKKSTHINEKKRKREINILLIYSVRMMNCHMILMRINFLKSQVWIRVHKRLSSIMLDLTMDFSQTLMMNFDLLLIIIQ